MSALLAHIKIVEGHEKHFEELSRELIKNLTKWKIVLFVMSIIEEEKKTPIILF